MKIKRKNCSNRNRLGVAAVEFSLTLPILLVFLFGTFELGRGNMILNTTEAAAYEGARVAIIPGSTIAEAEAAATLILSTAGVKNATIDVTPTDLATETDSVSVTISVSFADNSFIVPAFLTDSVFVRTCELNRER